MTRNNKNILSLVTNGLLILSFLFAISCSSNPQEKLVINEIAERTDTVRFDVPDNKYMDKLEVRVKGELTEDVIINEWDTLYKGSFDRVLYPRSDFYSSNFILHLKPTIPAVEGHLEFSFDYSYF